MGFSQPGRGFDKIIKGCELEAIKKTKKLTSFMIRTRSRNSDSISEHFPIKECQLMYKMQYLFETS